VYLPRHGAGRAAEAEPQVEPEAAPGGGTLLLVEDHEQVRTLVHLVLEKQGYAVLAAASGVEALAASAAHDGTIDLMITDLVMPGMDGKELAGRLRTLRPDVRVLYTSGYAQGMVEGHELEDGDAFLPKPYDQSELAAAIAAVLGGAPPA
jgi:two-component system, cell cycle sensor histidine kinase and response regulator CckA